MYYKFILYCFRKSVFETLKGFKKLIFELGKIKIYAIWFRCQDRLNFLDAVFSIVF